MFVSLPFFLNTTAGSQGRRAVDWSHSTATRPAGGEEPPRSTANGEEAGEEEEGEGEGEGADAAQGAAAQQGAAAEVVMQRKQRYAVDSYSVRADGGSIESATGQRLEMLRCRRSLDCADDAILDTAVWIDLVTGAQIKGNKALQVNVRYGHPGPLRLYPEVEDVLVPIYWVRKSGEPTAEQYDSLRGMQSLGGIMGLFQVAFLGLGFIMMVVGLFVVFCAGGCRHPETRAEGQGEAAGTSEPASAVAPTTFTDVVQTGGNEVIVQSGVAPVNANGEVFLLPGK